VKDGVTFFLRQQMKCSNPRCPLNGTCWNGE
jgi:hypothetical protein